MRRARILLFSMLILAASRPSLAQTGSMERVRIGVTGGVQLGTALAAQDGNLFADQEDMPVTTTASGAPVFLSGDVTFRLGAALGLSFGFSYAKGTADADLTADTPHPFYFDQPRRVTAVIADVGHQEMAFHAGLQHVLRLTPHRSTSDVA